MLSFVVAGLLLVPVGANLNLFMNETETKRLLGIPGELYYVRSGIINDYALSFNLPIKSDVDVIYFDWQNLRKSPPDSTMSYSLSLASSHPSVLSPEIPFVAKEGTVPTKSSVFGIVLRCSGSANVEVDIKIQLNISVFYSNITVLDIKRKKTCLKDMSSMEDSLSGYSSDIATNGDVISASGHVFYIGIGCACGAVLLIAVIIVSCVMCSKKSSTSDQLSDISAARPLTQDRTLARSNTPNNNGSIISADGKTEGFATLQRTSSDITELKPHDVSQIFEEIKINRDLVSLADILLEGAFGRIYTGVLTTEHGAAKAEQKIYVKTVTAEARKDQVEMMMRDGCLMKGICHDNILSVYAASIEPNQPPLLIYINSDDGNLKKFLQHSRASDMLSAQQLVYMSIQVARGMQHLHRKRILHKDLATRNCLINSQLNVRVTDCALSRDIFVHDYHCLGDNENRPVKWLALESLVDRRFSPASDMWSFGVTLWEMFTMAHQPYAEVDPFEMATYLQDGFRIAQPINCPNELFAIMACCWSHQPEKRPKFSHMVAFLQDFYAALSRFV